MSLGVVGDQLTPIVERTPIAGFWRRLAAWLVDAVVLGVPTLLIGLAVFEWAASLGQAGRLIGFVVALLYFGLLNSRLGGGQTLGKRLLRIRVTDRAAETLSPMRSIMRFLILGIPYFLNGVYFDLDATSVELINFLLGVLVIFVVFGGIGAIVYLFVFNRRTRQSLHDLAVGSFVVRDPPQAVPVSLATPRLHLTIVGCWLALSLIVPVAAWVLWDSSSTNSLQPLVALQAAIKAQPNVRKVQVTVGETTIAMVRGGTSTTSFLNVEAEPAKGHDNLDALSLAIASTVLERHPDLLGKQVLIVQVRHGFNFGIAAWSKGHQFALDAAAWREKLSVPPIESRKP